MCVENLFKKACQALYKVNGFCKSEAAILQSQRPVGITLWQRNMESNAIHKRQFAGDPAHSLAQQDEQRRLMAKHKYGSGRVDNFPIKVGVD